MQQPAKKKRGPFVYISVLCCFLIGLAIMLIFFSPNKLSSVGQIIADAKGNQPTIQTEELKSPVDGLQLFAETYEASNNTYTIEYPKLEDETFNTMMTQFIHTEKELFLALAENATKNTAHNLTISAKAYSYQDRFYSITFHANTDLNNEVPHERITTFVYDKKTSEFVTLSQLLDGNIRYLQTLNNYIYKQLKNNEALQPSLVEEDTLKKIVTPLWDNYTNFAIENNELVIYFEPGAVAQADVGVVSVSGSMAYLQSIFAKPFRTKLAADAKTIPLFIDKRKRVALTFDDGPHKKVTQQILTILDEFDAKATFFMLGKNVKYYPEVAKDVHSRGHEIGNHTWSHPLLTKLTLAEATAEYERTEQIIVDTLGENSTVFRPPFGATNNAIKKAIPQPSVNWSLDTLDWKHRNPKKTVQIVKKTMHNNAVILMHDIHQPTADSLREVLQFLQHEGYEFLTLSEIRPYIDYTIN